MPNFYYAEIRPYNEVIIVRTNLQSRDAFRSLIKNLHKAVPAYNFIEVSTKCLSRKWPGIVDYLNCPKGYVSATYYELYGRYA